MLRSLLAMALILILVPPADAQILAIRKAKKDIEKRANFSSNLGDSVTRRIIGKRAQTLTQVRQLLRRKHPEFVVSPLFLAILPLQVENV
jgi:hypothetical protein